MAKAVEIEMTRGASFLGTLIVLVAFFFSANNLYVITYKILEALVAVVVSLFYVVFIFIFIPLVIIYSVNWFMCL